MPTKTAVFGGGCFWCTEAVFKMMKGVSAVDPGYTGGGVPNPTYEQVCTGTTGHAEAVRVTYDPAKVNYEDLLTVFFASHDPTTLNRQGNDVGTQYRSAVFYADDAQLAAATRFIEAIDAIAPEAAPVVTSMEPLKEFYVAENYHKDYYARNKDAPYCQAIINPKLKKVKEHFAELLNAIDEE